MKREDALVALGQSLRRAGYRFVTVTPETHRRASARAAPRDPSLRDIFGWSRSFAPAALPSAMVELLAEAGALVADGEMYRSAVRFSSLGPDLFVHSAYPTVGADAVFFGPDTYRFCAAIRRWRGSPRRCVDIGCGTGAGGIVAARAFEGCRIVLADVNEDALVHARVNVALAALPAVEVVRSDLFSRIEGSFDLVVANPPYLLDAHQRTYRNGGGALGEGLGVQIAEQALARLDPGGTLVLYTGSAVVGGEDTFLRAVRPVLERAGARFSYEEVDPDVFGEELDEAPYGAATVERIAAVVLVANRA